MNTNSRWYRKLVVACMMQSGILLGSLTGVASEDSLSGAWLITDKPDYAPYEVALIAGGGFLPNELVDVSIAIFDPNYDLHIGDYDFTGLLTDGTGSFVLEYTIPPEAADMSLMATAMGLESGLIATVEFTDSHTHVLSASSITLSVDQTQYTVEATFSSTPPPNNSVSAVVNGNTLALMAVAESGNGTWRGTFSATCGTTYQLTAIIAAGNGAHAGNQTITTGLPKSVTTDSCGSENHAPVITTYNPCVDLGRICGRIGVGNSGFGHKVELLYFAVPEEPSDEVDVYLQVVVDDVASDPVLLAKIVDEDGDDIEFTVDGPECTVLNGPGPVTVWFDVDFTATDGEDAAEDATSQVKLKAQVVYNIAGFFSPLGKTSATVVKNGSTVPVKFLLTDCDGAVVNFGIHTICVDYHSGACPDAPPDPGINDSGSSNDNTNVFRFSDTQWIYNLSTKIGYVNGCTYKITAKLDDGTTVCGYISIKK